MNDYLEAWDRRLRTAGFRITPQRQLVLEAVTHLQHATPEEILEEVKITASGVNLSTVYRTLEVLEQVGLVTHAHIGHGTPTYHVVDDAPHIHLVCSRCRKVESINGDAFAIYANSLETENGFVVNISHLVLHGLCKKCANEGNVVTDHDH
ncbi:MAG: transcriptional repressor [Actinobacteria bacterium]|nr:transcriptional repressor [Actinomycetota bacterium]